ncbi:MULTISPECIES: fimbrial biogenesis chaperone [unclassified Sphingobium]|uniref:fimbrial biogenesis chaperone n=1 Tax=unclassified Sphingobium TaxID=2611147 RepID=UPI0009EB2462|nr:MULTISPECIES: fimbria/pilus periplasmic chaperone [unclassified Sphingobium]
MTIRRHGAGPGRDLAVMVGALFWGIAPSANAGALRILPVRIEMAAEKQFCSLTIANDDKAPATVQVRGFGWRKDANGIDLLDPDGGPVVNPSILSIPGGSSRLVRCSLPARSGSREESYRLIIDELPMATVAPGTVRTLLRISMPIFRAPSGAAPLLRWSVGKGADGRRTLILFNQGDRHVQVTAIDMTPAGAGGKVTRLDRGFYLLAGGRIDLPLESPDGDAISGVQVETATGPLAASTAVAER